MSCHKQKSKHYPKFTQLSRMGFIFVISVSLPCREGYQNPTLSSENLIGLSRARRPHNAIFINFEDEEIPMKPLDAAEQTWRRVCSNAVDHKAEEELRKVDTPFGVCSHTERHVWKLGTSEPGLPGAPC